MSTTTQAAREARHEAISEYQLTLFFFNAYILRELSKEMQVSYKTFSDDAFPHYNIFQFSAGEEFMTKLIQRLVKTGCPFNLSNFHLNDPV